MALTREQKQHEIESLTSLLNDSKNFYLTDISALNAEQTFKLRKAVFSEGITMKVVKNTFLQKAMEASEKDMDGLYEVLKGNTTIMVSEKSNAPAKLIKEFVKKNKVDKPALKAAFVEESIYVGAENLDTLSTMKGKEELIGDVILLLQSPVKNVLGSLQSGGQTIAGLVKTLQERGA